MSYKTYYTLSIQGMDNDSEEFGKIVDQFREENEEAYYAFGEDGCPEQDTAWDNYDTDLRAFSLKHPDLVFNLSGEGEEPEDRWEFYVKNGKSQFCQAVITFEPFAEEKLA